MQRQLHIETNPSTKSDFPRVLNVDQILGVEMVHSKSQGDYHLHATIANNDQIFTLAAVKPRKKADMLWEALFDALLDPKKTKVSMNAVIDGVEKEIEKELAKEAKAKKAAQAKQVKKDSPSEDQPEDKGIEE